MMIKPLTLSNTSFTSRPRVSSCTQPAVTLQSPIPQADKLSLSTQPRFGMLLRYMMGGGKDAPSPSVRPQTTTLLDEMMFNLMMPQLQAPTMGPGGKRGVSVDPVARQLLKNNIIQISDTVSPAMADEVMQKVMLLVSAMKKLNKRKPIKFIVNSPGGYIVGMHGILNAMKMAQNTKIKEEGETEAKPIVVETYCLAGFAASAASVIMAMGTPGHRYVGEFAEIMIHQPLGGTSGQETEIRIGAERISQMRQQLVDVFYETTKVKDFVRQENPDASDEEIKKLTHKRLHKMIERDNWLSSSESVRLGFADHVADRFPDVNISDDDLASFTPPKDEPKK